MYRLALLVVCASLTLPAAAQNSWDELYDGSSTDGWTWTGAPWTIQDGYLSSTGGRDPDGILSAKSYTAGSFNFEIKVRIEEGMRLRVFIDGGSLYLGNEGYCRQFEMYGGDLANVTQVGDDSYVTGRFYTLLLTVGDDNRVCLYKDGQLTHTATRVHAGPSRIAINSGDNWCSGQANVAYVRFEDKPIKFSHFDFKWLGANGTAWALSAQSKSIFGL